MLFFTKAERELQYLNYHTDVVMMTFWSKFTNSASIKPPPVVL